MPWYDWKAQCCGTRTYTIKEVDERNDPPEDVCACGECRWEREIGANVNMVRGDNWGGSKGNW